MPDLKIVSPRLAYKLPETARDLIVELNTLAGPISENPVLRSGFIFRWLAEHTHTSKLRNGIRLIDASDFHEWFHELAEEAEKVGKG
jgi:hypothetical protein